MSVTAPFPWFGGKRRVAAEVWAAFGADVPNYIEPFAGSLAVLLARPGGAGKIETVNDRDRYLCVAPETRVLTHELRWRRAADLEVGDSLLAFDEENPGSAREGLRAPTQYRRWRHSKVVAAPRVKLPCYRLTFDDGTTVVASEDHCWLAGSHKTGGGGRGWRWVKTKSLICNRKTQRSWVLKLTPVIEQEQTWDAGWMAGLFDGEGSLITAPSARLIVSQNEGPVLERAKSWLGAHGYAFTEDTSKRCSRVTIRGGLKETLRFLMQVRPDRMLRKFADVAEQLSLYGREHSAVGLVSKEFIGEQEVIALATTTKTFVAEGLASHNCNFWRAVTADPDGVARWADWPVNECAPAGTLISTPTGSRPIEEIRSGDVVWGFDGVRVVATRVTATRRSLSHDAFIKLGRLSLTGNHPVWTEDSGYVEASRLAGGERVRMLEETDADLGDLCAVGPEDRRRSLHRRDLPSEGSPERASVESSQGRTNAPRLLDPVPLVAGPRAGDLHDRHRYGGLASCGASLDCPPSRHAGQPHGRGRGNAGLRPDAGAPGEVVRDAPREEVLAGPHPSDAREDARFGGKVAHRESVDGPRADCGGAGEGRSRSPREASLRASQDQAGGCEAWKDAHAGAQREDRGVDQESEAGCLRRDGRDVCVDHGGSEGARRDRSVGESSHPQGLSLSREALAPGVAREVFNFQTETGNYFAERVLVHNCDLHARHKWLVNQVEFRERMHTDPDFFDVKIAGWWVWGLCQWIGGGWCVEPNNHKRPELDGTSPGRGVHSDVAFDPKRQLPDLAVTCDGAATGRGVHSAQAYSPGRRPNLSGHQGVHLPSLGNDRGLNGVAAAPCVDWFRALQNRLRRVRVACGDWKRVLGNSVLGKGKNVGGRRPCAVFLDPPYSFEFRDPYLYSEDDAAISAQVREWAIEHGDDPDLRIALCGYEGEHEMPPSWRKLAWKASRGYASEDNGNRKLERVWFSPFCLKPAQTELFELAGKNGGAR